jgi:hypothetical protein
VVGPVVEGVGSKIRGKIGEITDREREGGDKAGRDERVPSRHVPFPFLPGRPSRPCRSGFVVVFHGDQLYCPPCCRLTTTRKTPTATRRGTATRPAPARDWPTPAVRLCQTGTRPVSGEEGCILLWPCNW